MGAVDWVKKGSCHTAWAVPCGSSCSCSYAYGRGPAIGPHAGGRCWPLPPVFEGPSHPLMKPLCAEGDVPTAANLNQKRGRIRVFVGTAMTSRCLGEGVGISKLIVSVSFGSQALFKWKGKSCSDGEASSCCIGHGDILVMDGQCQDEFLHCTNPGLEQERINVELLAVGVRVGCIGSVMVMMLTGIVLNILSTPLFLLFYFSAAS